MGWLVVKLLRLRRSRRLQRLLQEVRLQVPPHFTRYAVPVVTFTRCFVKRYLPTRRSLGLRLQLRLQLQLRLVRRLHHHRSGRRLLVLRVLRVLRVRVLKQRLAKL